MKKTFVCDETMIITIPIGTVMKAREGQLMPDKFHCVYKDSFKVFSFNGKPKPLGAAQTITGVFIVSLGLMFKWAIYFDLDFIWIYTLPSIVFMITGMVSYAAGRSPNMNLTKLSFSLNILSFLWSIVAIIFCSLDLTVTPYPRSDDNVKFFHGVRGLILILLVLEKFMALFLIYWLSKAVCRQHFNTLPIIRLKKAD